MQGGTPITEDMRRKLKIPLGRIVNDKDVQKALLLPYFAEKGIKVSVGDRTTERLHEFGFSPELEIVDSLERRSVRSVPPLAESDRRLVRAVNPPGSISEESLERLADCLKMIEESRLKVRLEITGEEDLLALPIVAFFPMNTVTFYGQPNVGLVIVSSTESRERAKQVLEELGIRALPVT
jgi:GTP-dependent dephospho-CoA kinase